ncbi:MAG: hypothetical protein ACKOAR_10465, partial [Bacteroidota bacterium]
MNDLQRNGAIRSFRETAPGEFLVMGALPGKLNGTPARQFTVNPVAGIWFAVVTEDPASLLELLRFRLRYKFDNAINPASGTLLLRLSHPSDVDFLNSCEKILNILPAEVGPREETAIVENDLTVNKIDLMKVETGLNGDGNAVS